MLLLAVVSSGLLGHGRNGADATQATPRPAALHLGSTPWSPFTNAPGQPRYAVDLVEAALKRMGITADTAIVPEGTLTAALLDGRFDGSPALWRDPERETKLVYSKPYLENRLVLVARRGVDVSAPALPALAGKRIALVDGYAYGDALKVPRGPTYVAAGTVEQSLEKVLLRRRGLRPDGRAGGPVPADELPGGGQDAAGHRNGAAARPHAPLRAAPQRARRRVHRRALRRRDHEDDRGPQLPAPAPDRLDGGGRGRRRPHGAGAGHRPGRPRLPRSAATSSSPSPRAKPKPDGPKRFFLGGQVYEGWADIPESYKVMDTKRTPLGTQVVPVFSFKW